MAKCNNEKQLVFFRGSYTIF